jgi:CheY-like chemotaxis protein
MAILIAEDNPVSAKLVDQTLKKNGFQTFMAGNGAEALELLSQHSSSIEIVITDVLMPVMDGLSLAKEIKTSPQYEHIPVIVCTVLHDVDSIKKAAAIGCRHYLVKPFRPEDLYAKVLECRLHETKVMRSQVEIMSHYNLQGNQYAEIRTSFRQLLESYLSFTTERRKGNNKGEFDLVNIHECAVIFGTERLKALLEQYEKNGQLKNDGTERDQTLLNEMNKVVKVLSK